MYPRLLISTVYGEPSLERPHIDESAARCNHCKRRSGLASEEEQVPVSSKGRFRLTSLGVGVDVVKDGPACADRSVDQSG